MLLKDPEPIVRLVAVKGEPALFVAKNMLESLFDVS